MDLTNQTDETLIKMALGDEQIGATGALVHQLAVRLQRAREHLEQKDAAIGHEREAYNGMRELRDMEETQRRHAETELRRLQTVVGNARSLFNSLASTVMSAAWMLPEFDSKGYSPEVPF